MTENKYNRRRIGGQYERVAGEYLTSLGYEIVEYNFRCRRGEIDIIARDGDYLVFCEVKYRKDSAMGHPLEAVGMRKQQVISACAAYYLLKKGLLDVPCRFDVVSVAGREITLVRNAFLYAGG